MSTLQENHDEKLHRIDLCYDNLINSAVQGNITSSLLWIGQINSILHQRQDLPSSIGGSFNQANSECEIYPLDMKAIKYVFYQNHQRRSALHYAACNGHHDLVEYFLSLYLIFAMKISFDSIHKSQSFRSWFLDVNRFPTNKKKKHRRCDNSFEKQGDQKTSLVFSLQDYDQCMMQSNNQKVVNIMVEKKIDVAHAMRIVDQASFSCLPYIALIQPRMKKIYLDVKRVIEKKRRRNILKPVLVYDDENDIREFHYQEDDLSYDDSDVFSMDGNDHSDDDANSCFSCDKDDFVVVEGRANDSLNATSVHFINVESDMLQTEVELVNNENATTNEVMKGKFISQSKCNGFNNFRGLMKRESWSSTPLRNSTNTSTKSEKQSNNTGKDSEPPPKNNASQRNIKKSTTEKNGSQYDQSRKHCDEIDSVSDGFHVREGKRYRLVKGLKRSSNPE